ncbi:MAG: type I-U CRISPR-associated protein Csx17, partial [Planctomycetales bacterium]|nr:type I-U CRISPR-associated protein Csx17 [Planctomycetales bacterium]
IRRMGVAQGIQSFVRYGYLQRDNLATHFSVPLGRIPATVRGGLRLFDDLSGWFARVHAQSRKKTAPRRLVDSFKLFSDAVFSALTHDDTPDRWREVLRCAVAIESIQANGTAIDAGPIPPLNPQWIAAIGFESSPEVRLAVALGSAAAAYSQQGRAFDPVRHHCLPLQRGARQFLKSPEKRLVNDPRVVVSGRDPLGDCAAIVQRRLIEAAANGERRLRLVAPFGCAARLSDLAMLLDGHVDLQLTFELARALMAIKWDKWDPSSISRPPKMHTLRIAEAWTAIRLACSPWKLPTGQAIPAESSMIARLVSGDGSTATQIAINRLRAVGIRPPLQAAMTDHTTAKMWAAALVFPIDRPSMSSILSTFDPNQKEKTYA